MHAETVSPFGSTARADLHLREAQHRTANAFQMVSAMIARASRHVTDESSLVALRKADAQIHAFALINAMLAASATQGSRADTLCVAAYLRQLCAYLEVACLADRGVSLTFVAAEPQIVAETVCRHLALIATELVLNAAKHAFPAREQGEVRVLLGRGGEGEHLCLIVADDGIGIDPAALSAGRGLEFVELLADEIEGTIEAQTSDSGTAFTIMVPTAPAIA